MSEQQPNPQPDPRPLADQAADTQPLATPVTPAADPALADQTAEQTPAAAAEPLPAAQAAEPPRASPVVAAAPPALVAPPPARARSGGFGRALPFVAVGLVGVFLGVILTLSAFAFVRIVDHHHGDAGRFGPMNDRPGHSSQDGRGNGPGPFRR